LRWAEKLGVSVEPDLEVHPGVALGVAVGPQVPGPARDGPGPGAGVATRQGLSSDGTLILPPLASVARAHGFRSLAAARDRGRETRAERAAAWRGGGGPQDGEPWP